MMRSKAALSAILAAFAVCAAAASPTPQPVSVRPALTPNYYADIQPIVTQHCVSCHHDGAAGPFPLTTYHDVTRRAPEIAQVIQSGFMPPWKPDSHGELTDENRLSPSENAAVQQWVKAGAPEDKASPAKLPVADPGGITGVPDAVLMPTEPVDIPAEGPDFYHCFVLPTHFKDAKYLSAIVFKRGSSNTADHAIEYLDVQKRIRYMNSVAPGGGFNVTRSTTGLRPAMVIGGWGISTPSRRYPDGTGICLPAGADIVVEAHYHSSGKPERDLPKLLLYFCKGAVDQQVRVAPVMESQFRLNTRRSMPNMTVGGQRPLVSGISIVGVMPYMRYHGSAIRLGGLLPDKSQKALFDIPAWDFHWVGNYRFKEPVQVPAGSLLMMTAGFGGMHGDTTGPAYYNRKVVTWGDAQDDENAVIYVFYTTGREHLTRHQSANGIPDLGGSNNAAMDRILLSMFDTDKDGRIDSREQGAMLSIFGTNMPHLTGMDMM